jgi:hypothetical protein
MFFTLDKQRKTQRKVCYEMKGQIKALVASGVALERVGGLVDPQVARSVLGRGASSLAAAALNAAPRRCQLTALPGVQLSSRDLALLTAAQRSMSCVCVCSQSH